MNLQCLFLLSTTDVVSCSFQNPSASAKRCRFGKVACIVAACRELISVPPTKCVIGYATCKRWRICRRCFWKRLCSFARTYHADRTMPKTPPCVVSHSNHLALQSAAGQIAQLSSTPLGNFTKFVMWVPIPRSEHAQKCSCLAVFSHRIASNGLSID